MPESLAHGAHGLQNGVPDAIILSLFNNAQRLHQRNQAQFHSSGTSSEASFLTRMTTSGTLSDRLSALTLLIQSSPANNTQSLEVLKGMAERGRGKGGREEALKALRCIVDWWVGGGCPGRKLRYWRDQFVVAGIQGKAEEDVSKAIGEEKMVEWYFEDWLKKYFFSVLQVLETLSIDPLTYVRTQALTLISTLLREKPEQEQNLLRLLVNKLGDNEKSICSRASHHILQLIQSHPAMKAVIVREMIALIMKPLSSTAANSVPNASGNGTNKKITFNDDTPSKSSKGKAKEKPELTTGQAHARYYAVVTFNQIVLTSTPTDQNVAAKLLEVYFDIFRETLGISTEEKAVDGDGDGDGEEREVRTDKEGRVTDVRRKKGKSDKRKTERELKGAAGFAEIQDSQSKLVSAILTGVNRALPFVKMDVADVGIQKHIDTLFLITHKSTFNISIQALVLLQQISSSLSSTHSTSISKFIVDRYYRTLYTSLLDTRLGTSAKQAMYLNLLFKSIKSSAAAFSNSSALERDEALERTKALVRRFVQILVSGGPAAGATGGVEFVAGGLYLLGELFGSIPGLWNMVQSAPKANASEEAYDPRKREPKFAHASASPLWELTPLLHHYHPAISLHARQILSGQPVTASADLTQNTMMHFLDRFVYKNAKKVKGEDGQVKGGSAMQPSAAPVEGVKLAKGVGSTVNVNEKSFWERKESNIPVDQIFFHRYFKRKEAKERSEKEGVESESEEDDGGDIDAAVASDVEEEAVPADEPESSSELDEDEVWKAMKATMPKTDGVSDLDSDPGSVDDSDSDAGLDDDENDVDDPEDDEEPDLDGLSMSSGDVSLVGLDSDDEAAGDEAKWEEWDGVNKRKKDDDEKPRKKRKTLPTFASYDDYAAMVEAD